MVQWRQIAGEKVYSVEYHRQIADEKECIVRSIWDKQHARKYVLFEPAETDCR